jgi:hypothetical protein
MTNSGTPVRELLRQLEQQPSALAAADEFRQFVFALVDALSARQEQAGLEQYKGGGGARTRFDGYVPGALGVLPGPVAVEAIFLKANDKRDAEVVSTRAERVLSEASRVGVPTVVIAHNRTFNADLESQIRGVADRHPRARLVLWDEAELEEIGRQVPDAWTDLRDNYLVRTVSRSVKDPGAWKASSEQLLARLADGYEHEGVSLILGAGVSQTSGLPGWAALLGGLFTPAFREAMSEPLSAADSLSLAQAIADLSSESPLQTARYLRQAIAERGLAFEHELSSVLYAKVRRSGNSLLEALAHLCVPSRTGSRVHSVITYNFDDLFEEELRRVVVRPLSIFRDHIRASPDELAVYHVHGYLPRDRSRHPDEDAGLLAFSEDAYHQLYADPYHWTNIVQLNALRERSCIFVGLSLTDPNLRRLLDIAGRGVTEPRHFGFMKRISDADLTRGRPEVAAVSPGARLQFLEAHHALQDSILRHLGVNVVWYEEHDDLPQLLRSVRVP